MVQDHGEAAVAAAAKEDAKEIEFRFPSVRTYIDMMRI